MPITRLSDEDRPPPRRREAPWWVPLVAALAVVAAMGYAARLGDWGPVVFLVVLFGAVAVTAAAWGFDSRDGMDWRR